MKEKLSFDEMMLIESIKKSPEFSEIMKIIEESDILTEETAVEALAAKLNLSRSEIGDELGLKAGASGGGLRLRADVSGGDQLARSKARNTTIESEVVFNALLLRLGSKWIPYLGIKKTFRNYFLKNVKTTLGNTTMRDANKLIQVITSTDKDDTKYRNAVKQLDIIKTKLVNAEKN